MTYMDAVLLGAGAMVGSLLTFVSLTLVAVAGRRTPPVQADIDALAIDVAALDARLQATNGARRARDGGGRA